MKRLRGIQFKTIGARVGAGFIIMSLFVVVMGVAGLVAINSIKGNLLSEADRNVSIVETLLKTDRELVAAALAESNLLLSSKDPDEHAAVVENHKTSIAYGLEMWATYLSSFGTDDELERLFETQKSVWLEATAGVLAARSENTANGRQLAVELSLSKSGPALADLRSTLEKITHRQSEMVHQDSRAAADAYGKTMIVFGSLTGLALAVAALLGVMLSRSISGTLKKAVEGLSGSSSSLLQTSEGMSSEGVFLADGAVRQAARLEETSASLTELCSWTRKSKTEADKMEIAISQVVASVEVAHSQTNRLSEYMDAIQTVSHDTEKIVNVIDEIAFQTNLLALNAAVEAARAGSAGAGFSVVAEEVRNLAKRVAQSAKETQGLVASVIERVGEGNEAAKEAHVSIDAISERTSESLEYVDAICKASAEQDAGISQIQAAVESIDEDVQNTAEVASSSSEQTKFIYKEAQDINDHLAEIRKMIGMAPFVPPPALVREIKPRHQKVKASDSRYSVEFF